MPSLGLDSLGYGEMKKKNEVSHRLCVEFTIEDCDRGKILNIPQTGQLLLINETAARLLSGLKNGAKSEQLAMDLVEFYGEEPEKVRSDVARYLHDLVNLGMIEDASF